MISVHRWSPGQKPRPCRGPEELKTPAAGLGPDEVVWIDLDDPTPEEEQLVYQQFLPVHLLTLEDVTRQRREPNEAPHFPKVEEFPDYLFVVVNPLAECVLERIRGPKAPEVFVDGRHVTQLSAVLTEQVLVTYHAQTLACVDETRNFLLRHAQNAERGPDYLFHLVLDGMVDQYAVVLDAFDGQLEEVEQQILHGTVPWQMADILDLKHGIVQLRKTLVQEREVLARLARGDFALIAQREMVYYRNVYDHLVRYTELVESARDTAADLMQLHMAAAANRLNEVMKVLTMISTVVLPMTLIAGVYGMNFEHMPELKWVTGYPFALGLMALTGVVAFVYFRWRKWI